MLKILLCLLVILSIIDSRKVRIIRNPSCQCGIPSNGKNRVKRSHNPNDTNAAIEETRIINGKTAEANEYPWIVGLYANQRCRGIPVCGGTVISSHHILTAAHCVEGTKTILLVLNSQFEIQEVPFNAQVWEIMIYRKEVVLSIHWWIDSKIFCCF